MRIGECVYASMCVCTCLHVVLHSPLVRWGAVERSGGSPRAALSSALPAWLALPRSDHRGEGNLEGPDEGGRRRGKE